MKTVIVYDSDSLTLSQYKVDNSIDMKNYDCIITNKKDKNISYKVDYGMDTILLQKDREIELDPTTMEKIYKHNLNITDKKLENKIKKLEKEVERLEKVKNAIKHIEGILTSFSESDYETIEKYIADKYNVCNYEYDCY